MKHGGLDSRKLLSGVNPRGPEIERHSLSLPLSLCISVQPKSAFCKDKCAKWAVRQMGVDNFGKKKERARGENYPCHQPGPGGWVCGAVPCLLIYSPKFPKSQKLSDTQKAAYLLDDTLALPKNFTFFTHQLITPFTNYLVFVNIWLWRMESQPKYIIEKGWERERENKWTIKEGLEETT